AAAAERPARPAAREQPRADPGVGGGGGDLVDGGARGAPVREAGAHARAAVLLRVRRHPRRRLVHRDPGGGAGAPALPPQPRADTAVPARGDARLPARRARARRPLAGERRPPGRLDRACRAHCARHADTRHDVIALLWDLDGTLLLTGRAGLYAFEDAVREVTGKTMD